MLPMDIPAKRRRHPLGHEQRSLTGSIFSRTRDRGHRWLMGLEDGSGIPHQAVAGAPPVTRDGGAFGYVALGDGRLQLADPRVFGLGDAGATVREGHRLPRARSPGGSVTSSTDWATGCRPRRVVGHVIAPREFGLFEAGTSSLRCRLPVVGHFITADRKNQ